jgi:menaquinone-dependent protoporphyrinogen IX oxidase
MNVKKILVTYATLSGTTAEVARRIADELTKRGEQTTVLRVSEVASIDEYDAVILGAPMIVGWHRDAARFLKIHQNALAEKPLALFATAMSLTNTGETSVDGIPIVIDGKLAQLPQTSGKLTFKERYSAIPAYVRPMFKATGQAKPVSVALFGGRLDLYRLQWWAVLFVILILRVKPGEKRNWEVIGTWASSLF